MSILRALNTLAEVQDGLYTSAQLEALLSDPGRYSEWQVMCGMEKQFSKMMTEDARPVVMGSTKALGALSSSIHPFIYEPEFLARISPSAWGVYLPHSQYMVNQGSGVFTWQNALMPGTRNFEATAADARPVQLVGGSILPRQPVLSFDGVANWMNNDEVFNQPTAYTIFIVYRRRTLSPAAALVGAQLGDSIAQGFYTLNANVNYIANNAVAPFTNTTSLAAGVWGFSRFRRESANVLYHSTNGGVESDPASNTTAIPSFTTGRLMLGRAWSGYMQGDIAELWMVAGNGDANSPEIQGLTAFLKTKYGIN